MSMLQTPAGAQEPGLRQSALLVYAMPHADREWLLERLSAQERSTIATLLDELVSLGIPRSQELLEQAIAQSGTAMQKGGADERSPQKSVSIVQALDAVGAEKDALAWSRLCEVLQEEPARLVAGLLALHEWSWREKALRALAPRKRQLVVEISGRRAPSSPMTPGASLATTLNAAMLAAFAERVLQTPLPLPTMVPASIAAVSTPAAWWNRFWRST
jgi:hypothetical protein